MFASVQMRCFGNEATRVADVTLTETCVHVRFAEGSLDSSLTDVTLYGIPAEVLAVLDAARDQMLALVPALAACADDPDGVHHVGCGCEVPA